MVVVCCQRVGCAAPAGDLAAGPFDPPVFAAFDFSDHCLGGLEAQPATPKKADRRDGIAISGSEDFENFGY